MPDLFITCGLLVFQNMFADAYGGTGDDFTQSIIETSDGGFALAGYTGSFGVDGTDCLFLKLASDGTFQWAKTFGGTDYDYSFSVIQTSDGGFALAGCTYSFGAGQYDLFVFKTSSDGTLEWVKTLGGTWNEHTQSIIETSDGDLVVAGYTGSFGAGSADFMILKLASDGTLEWVKTFGGTDWDGAYSITETSDGGFAVAGWTGSFGAGSHDFLVLKLASDGTLEWVKTFGGTDWDEAYSITETSDGGFAVAGYTESFGAGSEDFLITKLASDGSLQWAKTFGGTDRDEAYSIIETSDGNLAVAGLTGSFGAGSYDLLILKLASDGSLQWAKTFGGTDWDETRSIIETSDGDLAVTGGGYSFGAGMEDLVIIKMGSDGQYPNCVEDCTPTETTPSIISSSPSVSQLNCTPSTSSPSLTMSDVTPTITEVCTSVDAQEGFLNPFNGIRYSPAPGGALFSADQATDLRLYSVDGRLVRSLRLEQGQNRVSLDKGVYLWQAGAYKGKAVVR